MSRQLLILILGEYLNDFEDGVAASFANRGQNTGDSQGESVTLETEPKEEKRCRDNRKANRGRRGREYPRT